MNERNYTRSQSTFLGFWATATDVSFLEPPDREDVDKEKSTVSYFLLDIC